MCNDYHTLFRLCIEIEYILSKTAGPNMEMAVTGLCGFGNKTKK